MFCPASIVGDWWTASCGEMSKERGRSLQIMSGDLRFSSAKETHVIAGPFYQSVSLPHQSFKVKSQCTASRSRGDAKCLASCISFCELWECSLLSSSSTRTGDIDTEGDFSIGLSLCATLADSFDGRPETSVPNTTTFCRRRFLSNPCPLYAPHPQFEDSQAWWPLLVQMPVHAYVLQSSDWQQIGDTKSELTQCTVQVQQQRMMA